MEAKMIYQIVCGELDTDKVILPEGIQIENEFEDGGKCDQLYNQVYESESYLFKKAGAAEKNEVEKIISCMNSIAEILAITMYRYGECAGKVKQ